MKQHYIAKCLALIMTLLAGSLMAQTGTINTNVWDDRNANETKQGSEPGISNVTVELYTSSNVLIGDEDTDSNGNATFNNVASGTYYLKYILPADHAFTGFANNLGANNNSDARPGQGGKTDNFSIAANETVSYVDAGMWAPGSITTNVWDDRNANKTKQGSEPGISNVTVELRNDADDALLATATTDGSGNANFSNVPADRKVYLKYFTPADHAFTGFANNLSADSNSDARPGQGGRTDAFEAVKGSENITYVDTGMWAPGSITTNVWDDRNANKTKQGSEPGISNVTVELRNDADDTLLATSTTDGSGNASFSNVPADRKVYLKYFTPADHAFTGFANNLSADSNSDARPGQGGRTDAFEAVKGSENITYVDTGMWAPGSITTNVWDDRNANKTKQGSEPGIENVTVQLLNDSDNAVLATATTDASGNASFSNVPADRKVYLKYFLPADHAFTGFANNLAANSNSDARPGQGGRTDAFEAVKGSEQIEYVDTGMWTPGLVKANVWLDQNSNGTKQGSEDNLFGVLVEMYETNGNPLNYPAGHPKAGQHVTALTQCGNGLATLYMPANRSVYLRFEANGATFTSRGNLTTNGNSDARSGQGGRTDAFAVEEGNDTIEYVDAGFTDRGTLWTDATVESFVWNDDGDGTQSNFERNNRGIEDVKVRLTDKEGNTCVCEETDANGQVILPAISGLEYRLKYDLPDDHKFTPKSGGLTVGNNSDANTSTGSTGKFRPSANETITYIDAGMWAPGTLITLVWDDVADLGTQSNFERNNEGIENVTVHLTETNGDILQTTTTNASGIASFNGVPANRELRLKYELPSDHKFTTKSGGVTVGNNSDAHPSTGITGKFKASKGSDEITYVDAGMWAPGTLTTLVWDDVADLGTQSNFERNNRGLNSVTVHLTETNGDILQTAITNNSGEASFTDVPANRELRLRYELPQDHRFTTKSGGVTVGNNSDAHPSTGITGKFKASKGSDNITYVDAGMWAPGTLTTLVWDDDGDGNQSNFERNNKGLDVIEVKLTEVNGNVIQTTFTAPNGMATFNNVPADRELRLKYELPADHRFTAKSGPVSSGNNSDAHTSTGVTGKFQASKGSDEITFVDAGMWAPGTLTTLVWDDDGDGNQSNFERNNKGLDIVEVKLTETNGNVIQTTFTNSDGIATFTDVPADRELRLKYELPADHRFTTKSGPVSSGSNSDAHTSTGVTGKFQASKGSDEITFVDAGMWAPGTLEALVWEDDGNGIQSNFERNNKGVGGVIVNLLNSDGSQVVYPTGHPNAGNSVMGMTSCTDGKALIDYVPANRDLRLEFVGTGISFTTKSGAVTIGNNSDAHTSTGRTGKFRATKGSELITYVDAGLTNTGIYNRMVTIPTCIEDRDITWVDENPSMPGDQISFDAYMTNGGRTLEVWPSTCVSGFNSAQLGTFSKRASDEHLEFAIADIENVGGGIHVSLEVTRNTQLETPGSSEDEIALGNNYPLGTIVEVSLEFYNPDGTVASGISCTDNNNLKKWRDMYEINPPAEAERSSTVDVKPMEILEITRDDMTLFPVPTKDILNVKVKSNVQGEITYQIVSAEGRISHQGTWKLVEGENSIKLNVDRLAIGQYAFAIRVNGKLMDKKFTKI